MLNSQRVWEGNDSDHQNQVDRSTAEEKDGTKPACIQIAYCGIDWVQGALVTGVKELLAVEYMHQGTCQYERGIT